MLNITQISAKNNPYLNLFHIFSLKKGYVMRLQYGSRVVLEDGNVLYSEYESLMIGQIYESFKEFSESIPSDCIEDGINQE